MTFDIFGEASKVNRSFMVRFRVHIFGYCQALARPANYKYKVTYPAIMDSIMGIQLRTNAAVPKDRMIFISPSAAQVIKDIGKITHEGGSE